MSHVLRRLGPALLALLILIPLLSSSPAHAGRHHRPGSHHPPAGPVTPVIPVARPVPRETCRHIDPNLVHGSCLSYSSGGHTRLTWIGSYRAPSGRTFFCIDYLYSSRLPARARIVSTRGLVNQLGQRVGDAEVAALNAVITRWAGHGTTGSDARDAAIALLAREVMGDGVQSGGTVVYPRWLRVGHVVRAPRGGVSPQVLGLARQMWRAASAARGPYTVRLTSPPGRLVLGDSRRYRVSVRSASGRLVPGLPVHLACAGPIACPRVIRSGRAPADLTVRPRDVGRFRLRAEVEAPAADGRLYVAPQWHTHSGSAAREAGIQRGWIAGRSTAGASATASARIVRAKPTITTLTSRQTALAGSAITDRVTISGLPASYDHMVTARLYGPYTDNPAADDCAATDRAGQVRFEVTHNGTYRTAPVTVDRPGHYVWQETLPGDTYTRPVTSRCGLASETTLVQKLTPAVSTVVSHQQVVVGQPLHDTVRVRGTGDEPVDVRWALLGPVAVRAGSCAGLTWTKAPVRAQGTLAHVRAGSYDTAPVTVAAAGCYTYAERIPATATTYPATSPPGLVTETTLVTKHVPQVSTQVSHQRVVAGHPVHDTIRVGGIGRQRVSVHWRLLGPLAPHGESCRGLAWAKAAVQAAGTLRFHGAGTHRSGPAIVPVAGCYTYVEHLPATPTTEAVSSLPGLVSETTLAQRRRLHVHTVVSDRRATTGDRLRDTVRIVGLKADDTVVVHWRLLGPKKPHGETCSGLSWAGAPVLADGTLKARSGGQHTATTRISAPGCYTYTENLPATPSTYATVSPPGRGSETSRVLRPPLRITPSVPSGASAGGHSSTDPRFYAAPRRLVRPAAGGRLVVPSVHIDAPVDAVGLDRSVFAIPGVTAHVGWLTRSAAPDDVMGASVLAGHVSDRHDRPGALWSLRNVRVGARLTWRDEHGVAHRFRVSRLARYPRSRGLPASVFSVVGPHVLHLVTCTSRQSLAGGHFHYADNLVVTAVPVS